MARIVRFAVRWWWVVVLAWATLVTALLLTAPSFEEVATFDDTTFLPADVPSREGGALVEEGWPDDALGPTIVLVLERDPGTLTDDDLAYARDLKAWLRSGDAPTTLGPVTTHLDDPRLTSSFVAPAGQAMFLTVGIEVPSYTPPANATVAAVRDHLEVMPRPEGLDVHVTGPVAVAADENVAIQNTVARTTGLTLALVTVILLLVYRSPVAPLVPLLTIGAGFVASRSVVALLAGAGMDVSSLYETFAIVIVFGAGTDYCLFLISRYHEELDAAHRLGFKPSSRLRAGTVAATTLAMLAVLGSSAATTIVGFSAQGVARFGLYRTMGPALAISIAVTVIAALTLAPALMRLFSRILFWPPRWQRSIELPGHGDPLVVQHADRLGLTDLPRQADAAAAEPVAGRGRA